MMETYGYTRLSTFQKCPKKHDYIYNQGLKAKSNIYITVGLLFHQCLEGFYTDNNELIHDAINKFKDYVKTHDCDLESDLLEYVLTKYTQFYADADRDEETIVVEEEYTDNWDDDDQFVLRVDRLVRNKKTGMYILRDTKTTLNKLKYTYEEVHYNPQLLTYIPFVEAYEHIKIDQIEIDEVRIAKLKDTPLNSNGKPTAAKDRLELTTYGNYKDTLESMGLFEDKAYANAIDYMAHRGHPLFQRISAQVLDPTIVRSNLQDMYDTYNAVKSGAKFRNQSKLCNQCDYRHLCKFDMYSDDRVLREVEINKIVDVDVSEKED